MSTRFKYYLAGPMSGYPQFNIPAFDAAADDLRARGAEIISPAELDSAAMRKASIASEDGDPDDPEYIAAMGSHYETWGQVLGRDVQVVADEVDGVVLLNRWWESKGARLEVFTAIQADKTLNLYMPGRWLGTEPLQYRNALSIMTKEILNVR